MDNIKIEKVIMSILNDSEFKNRFENNFDSIIEEFELSTGDVAFLKNSIDLDVISQLTELQGCASYNSSVYGCFDAY